MDNQQNQAQPGQKAANAPQNRRLNLTPTDIVNQDFGHKMRGYDVEEVDNYLDLIIKDYETYIEQIKGLQQENNRLKSRIDELTKQLNAQGGPAAPGTAPAAGSSVSNYDILKRISNLERHVFGASKAAPAPTSPRPYPAPRFNPSAPTGNTPQPNGPAPYGSGAAPTKSEEPHYPSAPQFQEPRQPQPANRPQQPAPNAPTGEPNPYQGGGTQYRNYGPAAPTSPQSAPQQPNPAPYSNPHPANPNPASGNSDQPSGDNHCRPQQ